MPESVVKPESRARAVAQMLGGIPVPAGFDLPAGLDATRLRENNVVRDRYQLGAQVAAAVACAWLDRGSAARRRGDEAAAPVAAEAMATSHRWPVPLEMNEHGDYPEVLWEYADAMATDAPIVGGKRRTVAEGYVSALGCR